MIRPYGGKGNRIKGCTDQFGIIVPAKLTEGNAITLVRLLPRMKACATDC